jgi:hypothetical protein
MNNNKSNQKKRPAVLNAMAWFAFLTLFGLLTIGAGIAFYKLGKMLFKLF